MNDGKSPGTADEGRYPRFVARRRQLNERLNDLGKSVDDWIDKHESIAPGLPDLALIEGLLRERANLLNELAKLDEDFVSYLLTIRR